MNIFIHLWSLKIFWSIFHWYWYISLQLSHWISRINEDDLDLHTVLNLGTHPMKTATFRRPEASQEMSVRDSLVIQVGFYYASKPILNGLPPRKLTWQRKIHHLKMYCISYWKWRFSNVMLVLKSVSFALHLEYGINPVAPGKYDKPSNSIKNIDWPKAAWNSFINR